MCTAQEFPLHSTASAFHHGWSGGNSIFESAIHHHWNAATTDMPDKATHALLLPKAIKKQYFTTPKTDDTA